MIKDNHLMKQEIYRMRHRLRNFQDNYFKDKYTKKDTSKEQQNSEIYGVSYLFVFGAFAASFRTLLNIIKDKQIRDETKKFGYVEKMDRHSFANIIDNINWSKYPDKLFLGPFYGIDAPYSVANVKKILDYCRVMSNDINHYTPPYKQLINDLLYPKFWPNIKVTDENYEKILSDENKLDEIFEDLSLGIHFLIEIVLYDFDN